MSMKKTAEVFKGLRRRTPCGMVLIITSACSGFFMQARIIVPVHKGNRPQLRRKGFVICVLSTSVA